MQKTDLCASACRAVFALFLAALPIAAGCVADPEHTNRFDPESPIELQAGGTFTGTVLLEKSASAAGVTVSLSDGASTAVTESDGRFSLVDIRPGIYSLVISKEGYRQKNTAEYELGVGEVKDIGNLELIRGRGKIAGTVGFPATAVAVPVTVSLSGEGVSEDTGTGADGTFAFNEIPIGTYTLTARGEGFVATCGDPVSIKVDAQIVEAPALNLLSSAARIWLQTPAGTKVEYTNQTALEVNMSEVDTSAFSEFRFGLSQDAVFSAAYAPLVAAQAVALDGDDGVKSAYVQFKDRCGNETELYETPEVELDRVAPSGKVAINDNAAYLTTEGGTAVLDISAGDDRSTVNEMQITVDGVAAAWEAYAVTANVTFDTAAPGTKTVSVAFRDEAGNESTAATDDILFDNVAPTGLSLTLSGTVADGAQSATLTRTPSVKATLAASDPLKIEMAVSAESLNCADAAYSPFATATTVVLTGTDGLKTVYACFRDDAGNTTSAAISAEISLDTTAPTGTSVTLAGGSDLVKQSDALSPVAASLAATGAAEYQISADNSFSGVSWTAMDAATVDTTVTLATGEGDRYAYARFRDAAGNESVAVYDFVKVDGKAPFAVAVKSAEDMTTDGTVTLELYGVDAETMYIDGDVADTAETKEWINFDSSLAVTLTDPAGGNEMKQITAKFRDAAGNEVTAPSYWIMYDNAAPSGAAVSLEGELQGKEGERPKSTSITAYPFVNVTLSATDPLEIYVAVSENSLTCASANYEPLASPKPYVLSATDGTKTVYACFRDKAGNYTSSPVSDTITLDMTVPSSPSIAVENLSDSGWTKEYQNVQVTLAATDASQMRLGFWMEGGPLVKRELTWKNYAASDTIPLTVTDGGQPVDGKYHVWAEFKDTANNVTPRMETIVQLDTTKPVTTTIQLGDGSAYTNNQVLTVGVMPGAETGFHSRIESMRVYPSSAGSPGNWTDFAPITTVSLPACPNEDCYHTIRLDLKDEAGNETSIAAEGSAYLDTAVPSAPNLTPPKYLITSDTSITLSANFPTRPPDNIPCDKNFLRFEMSGETNPGPDWTDCEDLAGSQCDPSDPVNDPVQFVYQLAPNQQNVLRVRAIDKAGNTSQDTFAVVTQDSTPPRAPQITRSEPEDGSIFLEWASPGIDADVSGYLVYYGSMSGSYNGTEANEGVSPIIAAAGTNECADGQGTCFGGSIRLTGIKNATDVYVAVSALDQVQPDPLEGAKSTEVRIQPNSLNPALVGRFQSVHRRMAVADHFLLSVTGDGVEAFELDDGVNLMGYKGGVFFPTADTSDLVVDSDGKMLYLAAGEAGIAAIDISNLLQGFQLAQGDLKATFRVPGTAVRRVAFMTADSGSKSLVFAAGDNGLYVVDASDTSSMFVTFGAMAGNEITAVEAVDDANGRHLFVGNNQYGLAPFVVDTDGALVPDVPEFYQPKDWGYCAGGCPVSDILVSRDRVVAVDRVMGLVNMDRAKLVDFANTYNETGLLLSYSSLSAGPSPMSAPEQMAALADDADGRRRFAILGQVPNQEYGKIQVWKYLDPTAPLGDRDKLLCDKGCTSTPPDALVTLQGDGGGILFDATSGGRHADDWIIASRQALGFEIFKYDPAAVPVWIDTEPEVDPTESVPGDTRRVVKAGNLVLLADGANGFIVVDSSQPANLRLAGRVPAKDLDGATPVPDGRPKVLSVAAAGPAALVGGTFGLVVVDLSKARDLDVQTMVGVPEIKKTVFEDKQIKQIEVVGNRAYVWEYTAAFSHLLHVFDISDVLKADFAQFDEGSDLKLSRLVKTEGASGGGMDFEPASFMATGDFVFLVRNSLVPGQAPADVVALDLSDLLNVKEAKASGPSGSIFTSIRVQKRMAHITDRKFGLLTYDLNPLVDGVINPFAVVVLTPLHMMPIPGSPGVVAGQTGLAFVGTRDGMSVANVALQNGALPVSDVDLPYEVRHMVVDGQLLWAAAGEGGLLEYALARPARSAPFDTKVLSQGGEAGGVALLGDWLFAVNTYDYSPGVYYNWKLEQYYARNLRAMGANAFNDPDPALNNEQFVGVGQVAAVGGSLYVIQFRSPHREACTGDPDCPARFKCVLGTCSYDDSPCNVDADCPQPGFRCIEKQDLSKKCVNAPAARCTVSADCPPGLICKDANGIADTQEPYEDTNGNGRCDTGVDTFTDLNGNAVCDGDEPWTDTDLNGQWDDGEPFTDLKTCAPGRAFRVSRMGVDHDGAPHARLATDWIAPPVNLNQVGTPVMHVGDTRVSVGLSGVSVVDGREVGQVLEIDLNDPALAPKDRVVSRFDLTPNESYWTPAFSAVERYGKYLYLLAGRELVIFDTQPFDVTQKKAIWGVGEQMLRAGDVLFVTNREQQRVRAYSLSDPLNPTEVAKVGTTSAGRMYLSGNYLFTGSVRTLANGTRVGGGFEVFNVETILDGEATTTPAFESVVFINSGSNEIAASGPYLMLANQNGIQMFEMR